LKLTGRAISKGCASGEALVTAHAISFLGSIDPKTGVVIERGHELHGLSVKDRVLVFPHGKGSTVGSYVIYQLSKNGTAPCAMVNEESEPIVAVGAIISGIPLVDRVAISRIRTGDMVSVDGDMGIVTISDNHSA